MDTSIFHARHFDLSRVSCRQTLSIDTLFVFPFVVCSIFNRLTFYDHILPYCVTLLTRLDCDMHMSTKCKKQRYDLSNAIFYWIWFKNPIYSILTYMNLYEPYWQWNIYSASNLHHKEIYVFKWSEQLTTAGTIAICRNRYFHFPTSY